MLNEYLKSAKNEEILLVQLELQAVIQVLLQQLVQYLDPATPQKLGDVSPIVPQINRYSFSFSTILYDNI